MRRLGWILVAIALVVGACSSSGGSTSAPGSPSSPATPSSPNPTLVPTPGASPTSGGAVGSGMPPPNPSLEPIQPRIVTPKPGQLGVHPIAAERLAAIVTGRKVLVEITYASGVEPCYVLDSVDVKRDDHSFAITLRQGHGSGDEVCIQLAELVRTFADLGELEPGTYTISDTQKGAQPITVTVA